MNASVTITPEHIASTEAAERYGLTGDHIASLCRRKKVEGVLMGGRVWFVHEPSLKAYLTKTQEAKEARNRRLSQQIKREYAATGAQPFSLRPAHVGTVLAVSLFVIGSFAIPTSPARSALADVPWEYVPASAASVSAEFYDATFMTAAVEYMAVVDNIGDLQAQSYLTLGAVVVAAAQHVPTVPAAGAARVPVVDAAPAVVLHPFDLADASRGLVASLGVQEVQLPPVDLFTMSVPAGEQDVLFNTLLLFPETLADTLTAGFADMSTWYAQQLLSIAQKLGDTQVHVYEQAAAAELGLSALLVDTWTVTVWSVAEHMVDGIYAVMDGQVYTYQAVADTMHESGDTMGAAVAGVLNEVVSSADRLAYWYRDANKRVSSRTESAAAAIAAQ